MESRGFQSDGELEAASGVSASLISRYQSGDITPTSQNLRKLAPHLGVRLGDLMIESGLATAEELGMVATRATGGRLDPAIADAQRYLADSQLPDTAKDYLRATIKGAIAYWRQQLGLQKAPHEPTALDRTARSGRTVRPKPTGLTRR
jgi:transcriptional regulator with XRE-family HTH domain